MTSTNVCFYNNKTNTRSQFLCFFFLFLVFLLFLFSLPPRGRSSNKLFAVPSEGSGFRCIRINGETCEPLIEKAATNCGLPNSTIRRLLPAELTLWVDPYTVCYRIGENGSISVLYDGNRSSPSDLESSGSENCCEISPEINKLVMDLYEKSNNSIITKPKRYLKLRQNNSPPRFYQSFYQSPSNNQYYQNKAF